MRFYSLILGIMLTSAALAKPSAEYLPGDADFNVSIPSPESVLGWEPGDWRIHHPDLVRYLYKLAETSDRVSIKVTGYTYEKRPLLQLVITSAENQSKIEELRQAHLDAARDSNTDSPLVVWLGYSVHGDEASGANAAPIIAWYLAASQSGYVQDLLKNTIIIVDPSLNPDGLDRFATFSNSNRSMTPVADRNARIHHQDWPSGRTNHYLFDLNRDWLPLVHPESRARITEFHRWLPHVITDHHETGTDGYFFQPGVPTRQHPLTTGENLEMTRLLATYHVQSMDAAGELYFTEDTYDDFYYGKGSTYPDINGGIGILFEQPRVQGPVYNRNSGPVTFSDAIHNHVRTSLSTLRGAYEISDQLKKHQAGFYKTIEQRAAKAGFQAWVIGDNNDPARARELLDLFERHQVEYSALKDEIKADGELFKPGHAWVVPVKQRQFGLAQAMLETRTKFEDNTFYDVSAWSLQLAYNLPYAKLTRLPATTQDKASYTVIAPEPNAVAWVIEWRQLQSPAVLQDLLEAGLRVRAATKPFSPVGHKGTTFGEGSLILLPGIQDQDNTGLAFEILRKAAQSGVNVHSFDSLMTTSGPGLGTPHFKTVPAVKPLLIVGEDTRAYDVGEAWHLLDQRLGVPPVMVEIHRLNAIKLSDYTHLLMVDGRYSGISKTLEKRITSWVTKGGVLVTTTSAASWAESLCFGTEDCAEDSDKQGGPDEQPTDLAYADFDDLRAQRVIGGAIVRANVDDSHPIAFGYDSTMPLFRKGALLLRVSDNPFVTPVRYTDDPLISGYIGAERLNEMRSQPAVIAERHGKGLVVRFANNPLFRGFWRGTERLWVNALYFGPLVKATKLPE